MANDLTPLTQFFQPIIDGDSKAEQNRLEAVKNLTVLTMYDAQAFLDALNSPETAPEKRQMVIDWLSNNTAAHWANPQTPILKNKLIR